MLFIIIGILIFGLLIAVHEFGHFITAKLFGVRVNEFSIGMGPALFKRQKGETLYAFRLLPIGGYCTMEGEDEDSDDPKAFGAAAGWKKIIILCAGAFMNFVTGLVLLLILYAPAGGFYMDAYAGPVAGYGTENCGLQEGDRFLSIDGHRMLVYGNARFYLARGGDSIDLVVERNGETVSLKDTYLPFQERTEADGSISRIRGIKVGTALVPATFSTKLTYCWNSAMDFVRVVWVSLGELIRGSVGLKDLAGPVGIVDQMTQVGEQAPTAQAAAEQLLYLGALIAVNLAVMNLLPLPALDGGRVFFLLLNGILFALFRKKIDSKYEGYVHMIGLFLLLALMLVVTLSDVGKIIGR